MNRSYTFNKRVRRSRYTIFRVRLIVALLVLGLVFVVGYFIFHNTHTASSPPTTTAQITQVVGSKETFIGPYFQFQDTGKWVLDKNGTKNGRYVYSKFNKNVLQHTLYIYVNTTPPSGDVAANRALPVRIVNDNSLAITDVSAPCGTFYGGGEASKIKEVNVNGALMICDPSANLYNVVWSEIEGDYRLHMKRPDGTPVQFVVVYHDVTIDPQPESLINVANSFQAR